MTLPHFNALHLVRNHRQNSDHLHCREVPPNTRLRALAPSEHVRIAFQGARVATFSKPSGRTEWPPAAGEDGGGVDVAEELAIVLYPIGPFRGRCADVDDRSVSSHTEVDHGARVELQDFLHNGSRSVSFENCLCAHW